MEETVFFNQNGVSVSNARFIVQGQTYAMNGVTSVKQEVRHPSRAGPIVLGIIGLAAVFGGGGATIVGLALLGGAVLFWIKQRPDWIVVLNSSSGEAQALTSQDRTYIDGVIQALNQSIIHRG